MKYRIFAWVNKNGGTWDPARKAFRAGQTIKGISDILGILPDGRFLAIEVKIPNKGGQPKSKPTDHQLWFLNEVNRNGGLGFVACSFDDIDSHLIKSFAK